MAKSNNSKTAPGIFENGLSYLSVPGPPLSPLTLGQLLVEAARKWTNSEFLYDVPVNTRLTFGQLKHEVKINVNNRKYKIQNTQADNFASGLLKIGLKKGDRIGIWGPYSCRWVITFLAAAKVGIIVVPLNSGYEAPELLYALNYLSVKCIVLAEPVRTRNFYETLKTAVPDIKISRKNEHEDTDSSSPFITSAIAPYLKLMIYMGKEQLNGARLWTDVQTVGKEGSNLEKMKSVAETVQCDDILYTPFTSGTTGRPKGAMISHHSHVNTLFRLGNRLCLTPEDKKCQILPLFHMYGCLVAMVSLCFGASVVIPSPTFSPSTAIKIVAQEKCTWFHGTPTMHFDMINTSGFDLLDLSSLQGAAVAGAGAAKKLLVEMIRKYGISKVTVGYGSTEGNFLTFARPDDPPELMFTSVGYPYENTEFKIIDARGRILPVGETGEICCRSFGLMQGYWEDVEKTREAIDPTRWLHTGDAGYFLESGHLVLMGRFKDMLIRGGANIYPKEIEDFLQNNLQVEEVAVFGVSDERLGEVVATWILPKCGVTMDTDFIRGVCEGKISRSKIPVYIKFVQSKKDFPRTSIGKVQKSIMRQVYEKELGLNNEIHNR